MQAQRQRLKGALGKIANLVGAPPPVAISPAILPRSARVSSPRLCLCLRRAAINTVRRGWGLLPGLVWRLVRR